MSGPPDPDDAGVAPDAARRRAPVLLDWEERAGRDAPRAAPDAAPPVPDTLPQGMQGGRAMQAAAAIASARPSRLGRWLVGSFSALFVFVLSLAAWDFVTGLLARSPFLGGAASLLLAVFVGVLLIVALREVAAIGRLSRLDAVHKAALAATLSGDRGDAQAVMGQLDTLYAGRDDMGWGRARVAERAPEIFDADGLLILAETALMTPLDARARAEVEAAARQVATVTAVVPLAFADVAVALTANLRMIRRIAEIYGGRAGTLGSWRMARAVFSHLVATGAVAVGDDLVSSIAGGGVLSKVSRRFGEGVINGALTARVGVAAMEVCRPLPFAALPRPSVRGLVGRALTGMFGSGDADAR